MCNPKLEQDVPFVCNLRMIYVFQAGGGVKKSIAFDVLTVDPCFFLPIASMYDYIHLHYVGKYTIHGSYGVHTNPS